MRNQEWPVWAELRSKLWPHHDPAEATAECRAYAEQGSIPMVDAVFFAEDESGATVGFLELSLRGYSDGCESTPVPHVEGWYVEPDARGRGAGRLLMRGAEDWARARGFRELASDTPFENESSLRAHESCGFLVARRLIKFRKPLDEPGHRM